VRLEHAVEVEAPIEDVFRWVTEPALVRRWMPNLVAGPRSDELHLGARVRYLYRALGQDIEATGQITGWSPPYLVEVRLDIAGIAALQTIRLERDAAGGTTLALAADYGELRRLERLLARPILRFERRRLDRGLRDLARAAADAGHAVGALP
jgi:uncharacterized protein YndB with AHSA1/START domain